MWIRLGYKVGDLWKIIKEIRVCNLNIIIITIIKGRYKEKNININKSWGKNFIQVHYCQ